ncbi:MAG TPA: condensation domain-containing protein, partial [Candidatus Kapabacteria bacterium]|nr:condensation domain-containing protein [Candidatus Kapabacteria bacterium]
MEKLDPQHIENILALTPLQEGMLFHYLQDPQSRLYCEQLSLEISGPIDFTRFKEAWNAVCRTNEMLRTVFRWEKLEKPSQIILKEHHCHVRFHDLPGKGAVEKKTAEKKTALAEIKANDRREGFDLRGVPFRVILVKLSANEFVMIISNHHILYDGWSNGIILREFFQAYHSLKIPAKPLFKEFVRWLQNQDKSEQEKFWHAYLADFETPTELSIKKKSEGTGETGDYAIILAKNLKARLEVFVKTNRVPLAAIFYTAWGLLLQKYEGSADVIFGTTVSGRSAELRGIENMVGLFINTVPLRIQTTSCEKLIDVVLGTDQILREREGFENTSLVEISRIPLFDTILAIENYPLDNHLVPPGSLLAIRSYDIVETTNYDLSIGIILFNEIEINFNYKSALFEPEAVVHLAGHFKTILETIIEKPGMVFSELEMISREEKHRVLYEFNHTAAEYPNDKTIHQLFVEQALRAPDHISLVGAGPRVCPGFFGHGRTRTNTDKNTSFAITYRQLNGQSDRLAGLLIEKGVMADHIVAIMMERSLEMVIGILGILKSGGAYLPIEPNYPRERTDFMLKDSEAKLLLTAKEIVFNSHHSSFITHHSKPQQLAYIIYTSGSTGKPKGVLIEHASVVNRLFWVKERYGLTERDAVLQASAFVFDVSVCELFRWIPAGARLCLLPPGGQMDPGVIVKTIARFSATTVDFVPSIINLIIDHVDKTHSFCDLRSLRWMFTGVETVNISLVKR